MEEVCVSRIMSMKSLSRRLLYVWPLIGALVVAVAATVALPIFTLTYKNIGIKKSPKIASLMYPTFGNPAIIPKGGSLTIEYDPRDRQFDEPFEKVESLEVEAYTSGTIYPLVRGLPVLKKKIGTSARWPEYAQSRTEDRRIYLATVRIPRGLPEDLYDITVKTKKVKGGDWDSDSQPHSLSVVNKYKDDFSFCQLTDIHVYGQENGFTTPGVHLRSLRPNGKDPERKGAVYYQDAISQVNTMKPEFCVFTGDFIFGQSYWNMDQGDPWGWTTEYQYEQLWFYEESLELDVPVFMTMGNHDSYAEGDEGGHEDWFENWRRLYGPLYFSFDYGDYHFLMLNTQDWPLKDRVMEDYGFAMQPTKFKGQVRGGADKWKAGYSEERFAAIDESAFTGQLAWARDDLRAHQNSLARIVGTHQDPWLVDGMGAMWASMNRPMTGIFNSVKLAMGFEGIYGNGEGRLALVKLFRDYRVALVLSGHFHSDSVGSFPWKDGSGQVIFANTTCTQFNSPGVLGSYPGYRRIWVGKGRVVSYNYIDPKWSYPFFQGTNIGGMTDLAKLNKPAIVTTTDPPLPGSSKRVTLTIQNTLVKMLPDAYAEIPMPYLSGGYYYVAEGGIFGDLYDAGVPPDAERICQVYTDVGPGQTTKVTVRKSSSPDKVAPVGTVTILPGGVTSSREVTLSLLAGDTGGSGVKDMMISNSPHFKGAEWVPYTRSAGWELEPGAAGPRTVYVKFRDYAMPTNASGAFTATINYAP